MKVTNVQLVHEIMKETMAKSLGEDISKLRLKRNISERYQSSLIFIVHKMTIHFNVFGSLVIDWIKNDMNWQPDYHNIME